MRLPSPELLTGKSDLHIIDLPELGGKVHGEMKDSLLRLASEAKEAGFELRVVSGFRSFDAQLKIWNEKVLGKRPILDERGTPLAWEKLSPQQIIFAILRWSALPGASRHHWGTDFDVYDAKAVPKDYKIQLTPEEVNKGGVFAPLHDWLDSHMAPLGFYRPYGVDRGGVSPERWHLSYAPLAELYRQAMSPTLLRSTIASSSMELGELVIRHLPRIYRRYVNNVESFTR